MCVCKRESKFTKKRQDARVEGGAILISDMCVVRVRVNTLLSYGDSFYSRENLFEILGTPKKTCLTCTGTSMKTCWKFWQS